MAAVGIMQKTFWLVLAHHPLLERELTEAAIKFNADIRASSAILKVFGYIPTIRISWKNEAGHLGRLVSTCGRRQG